jgi:hypothetical protein
MHFQSVNFLIGWCLSSGHGSLFNAIDVDPLEQVPDADPDQLVMAARDARERAMLRPDDLAELRRHPPFAGARL